MESVLQVTANDELFMHDEQSPARTSIEKQRRRMEFRVSQRLAAFSFLTFHLSKSTKRAFKIQAKKAMPKSRRLGV